MNDERRGRHAHWWWVPVLAIVVGSTLGYLAVGATASDPSSTSAVLVLGTFPPDPEVNAADAALSSNQYVNQRMPTYPQIAVSDIVTGPATEELGLEPGALAGTITATTEPDTTVLLLEVTGPTAEEAQLRNQAVTGALRQAIEQTENAAEQPPRVQLSVVSEPSLPSAPAVGGGTGIVIGAIVGALVGFATTSNLVSRARARRFRQEGLDLSQSGEAPPRPGGPARPGDRMPSPRPNGGGLDSPTVQVGRSGDAGPERQ